MHATIAAQFVDTRAADLSYALGRPRLDALDVLRVGPLELRLLGASHQAVLRLDGRDHSEVVACLPGSAGPVPQTHDHAWGAARYRFRSAVETLRPAQFAARTAHLRSRYDAAPDALVCEFDGPDGAMTVLVAAASGLGWQTWHGYPQTGELVYTRSVVRPAADPRTAIPASEGEGTR